MKELELEIKSSGKCSDLVTISRMLLPPETVAESSQEQHRLFRLLKHLVLEINPLPFCSQGHVLKLFGARVCVLLLVISREVDFTRSLVLDVCQSVLKLEMFV
jgi:hypothetical protein